MGMILPWNMPELLSKSSSVTISPFTLVFQAAGLGGVSHVMNVVILITVMSCGNSGMYVATRTLCALAKEGIAHKKLGEVNGRGVPIYALICTTLVSLVTFATSFIPGKALFLVLTDLSGVAGNVINCMYMQTLRLIAKSICIQCLFRFRYLVWHCVLQMEI